MLVSKYKAVIFDFDDTLVESRPLKWAQHKAVAKKFYNIDLTDEELRSYWGKPFHLAVMELYKNVDTFENIHKAVISEKENFLKGEYIGAVALLNELISLGVCVGIVSATMRLHIFEELKRLNFPIDGIQVVQGSDETVFHKPDGQVFAPILEKLAEKGIEKKDIVYVGDSMDDFRAAKSAGIHFVAVTTGLYSREEFKSNGATAIAKNIQDVAQYL